MSVQFEHFTEADTGTPLPISASMPLWTLVLEEGMFPKCLARIQGVHTLNHFWVLDNASGTVKAFHQQDRFRDTSDFNVGYR